MPLWTVTVTVETVLETIIAETREEAEAFACEALSLDLDDAIAIDYYTYTALEVEQTG